MLNIFSFVNVASVITEKTGGTYLYLQNITVWFLFIIFLDLY